MMPFCCVCVSRLAGESPRSLTGDGCGPAGQGRGPPAISSAEKTALSLFWVQGSGLLSLKPRWSVDGREAPTPLCPRIFARAKGWCLHKIPSFGAALGLSATSIPSAWGTGWKEMACDAPGCLGTPSLPGGGRGPAGCINPRCLERTKECSLSR